MSQRRASLLSVGLLFAVALSACSESHELPSEMEEALQSRRDSLIDHYANQIPADDLTRGGYIQIAANLYRNQNIDWVTARLDTLMAEPRGDMFWMYPFITVTFAGQDNLPADVKTRMRDLWRTYHPFRGDTENHWAMYYTAMYLITQMYPGEPPSSWFNGKSSSENFNEARDYLISWMDLTTTIGQGEYDSPDYLGVYIVPMAQLYAWADDPVMKRRAGMMLDYLLADFAVENLDGIYVGAHSRTYPPPARIQWRVTSTGLSWLMFGNTYFYPRGEAMILAMSGYSPPEIIHGIATDRSEPYVHYEAKRTRHRMRFSDVRNAPVYKTTYMRDEYAVGSSQGGLLQPIQQHTWGVTWAVDDPREVANTLFTVHPYSSPHELGMYFSWFTGFLTEAVVRSKTTYDSPWKMTGGSPYEQIFQHEDAVIALYDIEEGTRFPHINGFFSKDLDERVVDEESGWIFMKGNETLMAYYPLASYEFVPDVDADEEPTGHDRLVSRHLKNGAIVQVATLAEHGDLDAFADAVKALPLETSTDPTPSVSFTTLDGAQLVATYGETPTVDGTPVDYDAWPLFGGPFLNAERHSKKLEMVYGEDRRVLDFGNVTILDD